MGRGWAEVEAVLRQGERDAVLAQLHGTAKEGAGRESAPGLGTGKGEGAAHALLIDDVPDPLVGTALPPALPRGQKTDGMMTEKTPRRSL